MDSMAQLTELRQKRTTVDFSKHELHIIQNDSVLIHDLKIKDSNYYRVTFINSCGIMAITGDLGNWIFCREFHPSSEGYVSRHYWCEKLQISSTQKAMEFDTERTLEEINKYLDGSHDEFDGSNELTDDEIEYLEHCKDEVHNEFDYLYVAHRENVGRFEYHEHVIYHERIKPSLNVIFDAFNEICDRIELCNT